MRWCELRLGQRAILDELLKQAPANHRRSLLCASLPKSTSPSQTNQGSGPSSRTAMSGVSSSSNAQKYTPSGGYVPSSGNNTHGSQPGGHGPVQPVLDVPPTANTSITNANGSKKGLWVIFGVNGPRTTPELDQIGDQHLASDPIFLRKLRRKHRELRGWPRIYLSYWQLNHWEFVKVKLDPSLSPNVQRTHTHASSSSKGYRSYHPEQSISKWTSQNPATTSTNRDLRQPRPKS
jgi:hypothetical protein